jgi:GTP-binding protein
VVDTSGISLLVADIPGLIEGASKGKGLGDDFLRHVSRCKVLLHLIDATSPDIEKDYTMITSELKEYSEELAQKPQVIVLTKIELVDDEIITMQKELLQNVLKNNEEIYTLSAQAHTNIKEVMHVVAGYVIAANESAAALAESEDVYDGLEVITLQEDEKTWHAVKLENGSYLVTGKKIESFAKRTDYDNDFGVMRLRDILKKMGITNELLRLGIDNGDKILIGDPLCGELEY